MENEIFSYNLVIKWTMSVNIFELEHIYIPIHLKTARHWVSVVVKPHLKQIEFFDSLYDSENKEDGMNFMCNVLNWIVLEASIKYKRIENTNDWTLFHHEDNIPQQKHSLDCGVFVILSIDFLTDSLPLVYGQEEMPYFRLKIGLDIMNESLNFYPLYNKLE